MDIVHRRSGHRLDHGEGSSRPTSWGRRPRDYLEGIEASQETKNRKNLIRRRQQGGGAARKTKIGPIDALDNEDTFNDDKEPPSMVISLRIHTHFPFANKLTYQNLYTRLP